MRHTLGALFGCVLITTGFGASATVAASRNCEDSASATLYLSQQVEGMTAAAIADDFLKGEVLPDIEESLRDFWQAFGTSEEEIGALVEGWSASETAKNAVLDRSEFIEMLRRLRATIIAFEAAREAPESAAELLAGDWNDWRAEHMTREAFVQSFLGEVSARIGTGVPEYGATLQAAQATRNRLDDMHGAAGLRNPPDDVNEMWLWDLYLRGKAVVGEVAALRAMRDGVAYWNEYVIGRRTTIRCTAASLEGGGDPASVEDTIARLMFPTAGYSNPEFFQAIYDARTEGMRVADVGFYLTAFLSMFTNADIPECQRVVSETTLYRIASAGSADLLGQIFGGLLEAHRGDGSRDDLFGHGFQAGAGTFGGMMLSEASAQSDAQLFYDRHGCDSPVADRFFGNISDFAAKG